MYQQCGSKGARVGAFFLDGIFINVISGLIALASPSLYLLVYPFLSLLYFGLCEGSSMSASLGKRICGLIVVDEYGMPLNYGTAFLRSLGRIVSGLCLGVGFLIGLFDPDGKTLHDRLAHTFVASSRVVYHQQTDRKGSSGMNPQIIGISGQYAGRSIPVAPQGSMLGTDAASCDFPIPHGTPGISRNHCKIQFNSQTQMFILYDLGSTYGTFLGNGSRVMQGQPMALRPGDEFYLASRAMVFRVSL